MVVRRRGGTRKGDASPHLALLIVILAAACGACSVPRHVEMFSTGARPTISFDDGNSFSDAIVPTTPRAEQVSHIFYKENGFRIVQRTSEGSVVREAITPRLFTYLGMPIVAVGRGGTILAYCRGGDLYLYDLTSRQETLLAQRVADELMFRGIAWIDNRYLIAIVGNRARIDAGQVLKIDTESRQIVGTIDLSNPWDWSLSPSGRHLAVTEAIRGGGIKIIDSHSLSPVAEIRNGNLRSWMNAPAWNSDETRLAYRDGDGWLSVFAMGDGASRRVTSIPEEHVCYFLAFPTDSLLVYRCAPPGGGNKSMYFLDLDTARVVREVTKHFNGECAAFADGAGITCQIGYY